MRYSLLLLALLLCQPFQSLFAQSAHSWDIYVKPSKINTQLELENEILIGTDAGIAVFDRNSQQITDHWTRKSHGLPSNKIEAIVKHPLTQQLIIGTYDLGVFRTTDNEDNQWEQIAFPAEFVVGLDQTYCMAYDDQNRLCVGTSKGLLILDENEEWLHYGPGDFNNFVHGVWDMVKDADGALYAGSNVMLKIKEGNVDALTAVPLTSAHSDSLFFAYGDRQMFILPNGDLWTINDVGQSMRYSADGEWSFFNGYAQEGSPHLNLFDRHFVLGDIFYAEVGAHYLTYNGSSWDTIASPYDQNSVGNIVVLDDVLYGDNQGQFLSLDVDGNTAAGSLGNWPYEDRISSLVSQPDGACWVRENQQVMSNLVTGEVLELPVVEDVNYFNRVVFAPGGSDDIWLVSNDKVFHWQNRETVTSYPFATPPSDDLYSFIFEFVIAGDGRPWFRNNNDEVYALVNGQWQRRYAYQGNGSVYSIVPIGVNQVAAFYVNNGNYVVELLGPVVNSELYLPDFLSNGHFSGPLAGTEQDLWLINWVTDEVARFHNGSWTESTIPAELDNRGIVRHLHAKEGEIVLVTGQSIALYDGENWTVYNGENAPIDTEIIYSAGTDENGNVYVLHSNVGRQIMEKLTVSETSSVLSPEGKARLNLEVYPNPAVDHLTFDNPFEHGIYSLYDQTGRMLLSGLANSEKQQLSISHLPAGNYILSLEGNGQRIMSKLVVK